MRVLHIIMYFTIVISISSAAVLVLLSGASAESCAFWRLVIAALITLPAIKLRKAGIYITKRLLILVLISGISLGLHLTLWMDSLFKLPVIVSTTIVVTYPVYALILEVLVLKARVNINDIVGVILSLLGIIIYFHEAFNIGSLNSVGVLEAFLSSLLASTYFFIGRIVRGKLPLIDYVLPTYLVGALTVSIYSLLRNVNILSYNVESWVYLLLLAVIPMTGGHTLMNYLLKFYRSYVVSSAAFLEPLGSSLLAYLILNQVPRVMDALGVPLVLLGITLILKRST